jgi:hypothetical protein
MFLSLNVYRNKRGVSLEVRIQTKVRADTLSRKTTGYCLCCFVMSAGTDFALLNSRNNMTARKHWHTLQPIYKLFVFIVTRHLIFRIFTFSPSKCSSIPSNQLTSHQSAPHEMSHILLNPRRHHLRDKHPQHRGHASHFATCFYVIVRSCKLSA